MFGEAAVSLIVDLEFLFARFPQNANGFLCVSVQRQMSLDTKALAAMFDIGRIRAAEVAFRKTEIMNGIEQVGLSGAIAAANANNPFGKPVLLKSIILELEKRYGLKVENECKLLSYWLLSYWAGL